MFIRQSLMYIILLGAMAWSLPVSAFSYYKEVRSKDYRPYKTFDYRGRDRLYLSKELLGQVRILYHKTNPLLGYIAIPIEMRTKKEHIDGTYLGKVDDDETRYGHVFLRKAD